MILANVRNLAPAAVDKLEAYVHNGGGVWMALGSQTEERFSTSICIAAGWALRR